MQHHAGTVRPVTDEEIRAARERGEVDATEVIADRAPDDPILRVAWATGYGKVEVIKDAVELARAAGVTWRQLGDAMGENWRTVQSRYGGGQERYRQYRERQRAKEQGE
jgi:hypothetical protein